MTLMPPQSSWVTVTCPRPSARVRLFCLPFAGGGASRYREWPAYLPEDVEVVPIQLPGRESRFCEPAIDSIEMLADQLTDGISGYLDRPFALFGHSMGALIAFELARRLRRVGFEPIHFFASGCRAPHVPSRSPKRHVLPDSQFVAALRNLNGIPPDLLENAEFMALLVPMIRSDFKLAETYRFRPQGPLSCPVSAFGGHQDDEVTDDDLEAWSHHTTGPFDVHLLPGDHFFVNSSRATLLRIVSSKIGAEHASSESEAGRVQDT
jgi:medium-chain acyl-[acyl-carrier-protein] hydrolase